MTVTHVKVIELAPGVAAAAANSALIDAELNALEAMTDGQLKDLGAFRLELTPGYVAHTIVFPAKAGKSIHFTLAGAGQGQPIINKGSGPCVSIVWGNASALYGQHVRTRLEGITLQAEDGDGLYVSWGGKSLEIDHVWCEGSSGRGAVIEDAHGISISALNATGNGGIGVVLNSCNEARVVATSRVNGGAGFEIQSCKALAGSLYGEANTGIQFDLLKVTDSLFTMWAEAPTGAGGHGGGAVKLRECWGLDIRGSALRDHGVDMDLLSATRCTVEGRGFELPAPSIVVGDGSKIKRSSNFGGVEIWSGGQEVTGFGTRTIHGDDITVKILAAGGQGGPGTLRIMDANDLDALGFAAGDLAVFECTLWCDHSANQYFNGSDMFAAWLAFAGSGDAIKPTPWTTLGERIRLVSPVSDPIYLQLQSGAAPGVDLELKLTDLSLTLVKGS